ncbi:UPF0175 family protein [Candidatus Micrarchaeota archaeon]|nr:UPF0175 family protein [Candidatus Micrarchaeota archaeon]
MEESAILEIEKQKIIKAYREKRLTIRTAAEALGIDYWQMQELMEESGVPVADLTDAEIRGRKDKFRKICHVWK